MFATSTHEEKVPKLSLSVQVGRMLSTGMGESVNLNAVVVEAQNALLRASKASAVFACLQPDVGLVEGAPSEAQSTIFEIAGLIRAQLLPGDLLTLSTAKAGPIVEAERGAPRNYATVSLTSNGATITARLRAKVRRAARGYSVSFSNDRKAACVRIWFARREA